MSISIRNATKSFSGVPALEDVSLDVEPGKILVLVGPSGTGKTLLLRMIAGVEEPDSGEIRIHGRDMSGIEPEDRGVGMAFQNFALFPHMDAFANIAAPLVARNKASDEIRESVGEIARLLKIEQVLSHMPKELSNGQKQRTSLARALVAKPAILLLDDPLRNVDAKLRFEMRLELPRLLKTQNATVIYVTQDYKEAMALGHEIAVMGERRVKQVGAPVEIFDSPSDTGVAKLFGDPAINLLEVRPERKDGKVVAEVSGTAIALPDGYDGAVGNNCLLGLRPEFVGFVPQGSPGALPVTVEAETPLNEKTVTLVKTQSGKEILVSRPYMTEGPASGQAHVAAVPGSQLLFEADSGRLVARSPSGSPGVPAPGQDSNSGGSRNVAG